MAEVLANAAEYAAHGALPAASVSATALLRIRNVELTPIQRADLRAGLIDPRLMSALAAVGRATGC